MSERLRQMARIDLGKLLRVDTGRMTLLPCLMIFFVVVNKCITFDVLEMIILSYTMLGLSLLSFVLMAYLYVRRGAMSMLVFLVVIFEILLMASTVINGTDVKNCLYDVCSIVFIAMVCDYYKDRFHMLVAAFAIAFSVCAYLNLLHMLAHPDLWIVTEMKADQGYLLGNNYNGMGCRLMCAAATSVACLRYSRWWLLNVIPVMLISVVTLGIVQSMTSLTGIVLFLLFCLIPSYKLIKTGIVSLLAVVILFQFMVCFQGKGIEHNPVAVYFVEDVLGKDITFTNRTLQWDASANIVTKSPVYGYGYVNNDWYLSQMSSFAKGTHNYIWGVLVNGGILLLAVFTCICILSYSRLFADTDRYVLLLYAASAVLFLMMLMENCPHIFTLTLILLPAFAPRLLPERDTTPQSSFSSNVWNRPNE